MPCLPFQSKMVDFKESRGATSYQIVRNFTKTEEYKKTLELLDNLVATVDSFRNLIFFLGEFQR
jgi:hypothetical protein